MSNIWICEYCGKQTESRHTIFKQIAGVTKRLYVCKECAEKHDLDLQSTRDNFQAQFGEKEPSKPATDVDIHKIIDDAMEKKDRSVHIFISEAATSVYVNPYEDKPMEWINVDKGGYLKWERPVKTKRELDALNDKVKHYEEIVRILEERENADKE